MVTTAAGNVTVLPSVFTIFTVTLILEFENCFNKRFEFILTIFPKPKPDSIFVMIRTPTKIFFLIRVFIRIRCWIPKRAIFSAFCHWNFSCILNRRGWDVEIETNIRFFEVDDFRIFYRDRRRLCNCRFRSRCRGSRRFSGGCSRCSSYKLSIKNQSLWYKLLYYIWYMAIRPAIFIFFFRKNFNDERAPPVGHENRSLRSQKLTLDF